MPHPATTGTPTPARPTYQRHGAYPTTAGTRELAAAYNPDRQRWVLVDALKHPHDGDLDARIVDETLETPEEARALATEYLLHARTAHGPLVS